VLPGKVFSFDFEPGKWELMVRVVEAGEALMELAIDITGFEQN
jgi:hypothetical protein